MLVALLLAQKVWNDKGVPLSSVAALLPQPQVRRSAKHEQEPEEGEGRPSPNPDPSRTNERHPVLFYPHPPMQNTVERGPGPDVRAAVPGTAGVPGDGGAGAVSGAIVWSCCVSSLCFWWRGGTE